MHQRSASHSHPLLFQRWSSIGHLSYQHAAAYTNKETKETFECRQKNLSLLSDSLHPLTPLPMEGMSKLLVFFFFIIFKTKIFSSVLFHNTLEILHVFALTTALSFQNSIEYTRTKPPKTLSFPSQKCTSATLKPSCIYSLIRTAIIDPSHMRASFVHGFKLCTFSFFAWEAAGDDTTTQKMLRGALKPWYKSSG